MASTNKTTNYELSQFEGTDKPSWEADYNADMLSIDTNLKAVSDIADGASGSISTLADRVTAAEGNISTNANDIDALEARADALESGETVADGRLDALEAEQLIQNTAIESNTQLGYNLARPYDSASTYAVGAYVLFQNTLYKCTTAVSTGEAFDPTKWLAIKATDEIGSGGGISTSYKNTHGSMSSSLFTFGSATGSNVTINHYQEIKMDDFYFVQITLVLDTITSSTITIPLTTLKTIDTGATYMIYAMTDHEVLPVTSIGNFQITNANLSSSAGTPSSIDRLQITVNSNGALSSITQVMLRLSFILKAS